MVERQAIYAHVRETTQIASDLGMVDRARQGKSVLSKTVADYDRIGARRIDLDCNELGLLMSEVTAASWHKYRAALMHVLARQYIGIRKDRDDAQRAGDWTDVAKLAVKMRRAVDAYSRVAAAERPEPDKPRASKRRTLPRSDDWQARVYDAATPAQRASIALMWATGCRPAEVETGVMVDRIKFKGGKIGLRVTIHGAKLTEHSGQPTRLILIDEESQPGRALLEQMRGKPRMKVQRKATRINKDFEKIRSKTGLKVAPYSMRHQFSANLKAEWGSDAADRIAMAMGHAVTRSQGRYGSVRQAQSGKSGVLDVRATRSIKETRSAAKELSPEPSPRLV